MKIKVLNYILFCCLVATILVGTDLLENQHWANWTGEDDTFPHLITIACDGPDGVMLQ